MIASAASHYYSKSSLVWNTFSLTAVLYSALSNLAMVCLRPIPLVNRALPAMAPLPKQIADASNNVAIITGSNTGIGFEVAKALVERGYHVVMACRSENKAMAAIQAIQQALPQAPGKAVFDGPLDLSNMASVNEFCNTIRSKYDRISLLINNAGRNTGSDIQSKDKQGFDLLFQTNYLCHFSLTKQLLPLLLAADQPRVINLSSVMHHFCHNNGKPHDADYWKSYALVGGINRNEIGSSYSPSKLAALLFTIELNHRYGKSGLRSIAVNPGAVNSDIWRGKPAWLRRIFGLLYLNNQQGSYTTVAAAVKQDWADGVIYLQPYHQVMNQQATAPLWPPLEMLGVFVGYRVTQPRLARDGSNGALSAQVLWETTEALLAA